MKEKNEAKTNVSTILLVVAIIVIIAMGYLVYKLYNEKTIETDKVSKLNSKISELENVQKNTDYSSDKINDANENAEKFSINTDNTNEYRSNFSKSVVKELGEDNMIYVDLSGYDDNNGTGYVSINNKHEAYIYLSTVKEYSLANNLKKISDNVVNAWYCEEGQAAGNSFIIFLKENGTVTYVRFRTNNSTNWKTTFESEEKELKGITDISDIVKIEGGDENGIGGMGVLLIKSDGTCLPYSTLNDLTK